MVNITNSIVKRLSIREFQNERFVNFVNWCGKNISTPENRLILGVTALATQPFIDLYNKRVDPETRKVSVARTIAKIIAGTTTGVILRASFIKFSKKYSSLDPLAKGLKRFLTPRNAPSEINYAYEQYQKMMGTIFGVLFSVIVTNFAIDAPATKYLTNYFNKKFTEPDKKAKGVLDD